MTKSDFLEWANGKRLDTDGVPANQPYQCVDLIKVYLERCYEIKNFTFTLAGKNPRGFAKSLWENFNDYPQLKGKFSKIKNTPSFVPAKGDIVVWGDSVGEAGHVAIAVGKNTGTSKFVSLDQNWSKKYYCTEINHNYKGVYGVLRPLLKCATLNLNVRSGPGTMNSIVGELEKDELVRPLEYKNNFARIGEDKWVSAKYLD